MKRELIQLLSFGVISTLGAVSSLSSCASVEKKDISGNQRNQLFNVGEYLKEGDKLISFGINYILDDQTSEPYLVSRQIRSFQNNGRFRDLEIIFKADGSFKKIGEYPIIYHEVYSSESININGKSFEIEEITKYDCGIKKLSSELQLPNIKDYQPDGDFDLTVSKSLSYSLGNEKSDVEKEIIPSNKVRSKFKQKI